MSDTLLSGTLTPHHRLHVDTHLGPLHLCANLELTAPWTVIFGPSGSGKSTLLRAACGLLRSNKSRPCFSFRHSRRESAVAAESHTPDTASEWSTLDSIPPHLRHLAYAPQGSVLFPHLTVRQNIAFAADATRHPSADLTTAALTLFELTPLADRLPRDLSGGERQRVNLARAFAVPNPSLFLLDEPFTGIDRSTRDRLIPALRQHTAHLGVPVLSVTHDVEEALLLNAEVIRLAAGRIAAQGPATEVLAAERASILQSLIPNP